MYLNIKNVSKNYENREVLKNINFEVEKGELACILGPSGCGKTTLLNVIGGFLDDFSGSILIDGEDITNLPPEKRPVSTVFQSYGLFSHKNVVENVAYGLKFLKLSKKEIFKRASDVLEKVGLEGYDKKQIAELSGGEQQRVAIARSLVLKPKVLLLDEPFSNLDVHLRGVMREEVKNIQREFGVTMVIVTHDQEDAFRLANKIIVLNEGAIEQIAAPNELYKNPKTKFVSNFIGDANILDEIGVLRPEKIRLFKSNVQDNIILEKIHLGSTIEYKIKTSKFKELKVLRLSSEEEFFVGEGVDIEFINY